MEEMNVSEFMEERKIVIFGGSGSFGTAMTRKILENYDNDIIIFSRNEKMQFEHKEKFKNDRIRYVIGDIRDYKAVYDVLEGVDAVLLASAMKHIDKCEKNPDECRKTNIDGCINVINASIKRGVKKLVFLSTDKATNPSTLYGMSKLFVETYIKCVDNKNTKLITTRYGNVLFSNGSVGHIFNKLAKEGKSLTVTTNENGESHRRFFMTINQAVDLVEYALQNGKHGDLWVYNNKQCNIEKLARAFSDNIEYIKERCVEKTDEALLTVNELNHSVLYPHNFIRVSDDIDVISDHEKPFTSETAEELSDEELKEMIEESKKMGMI